MEFLRKSLSFLEMSATVWILAIIIAIGLAFVWPINIFWWSVVAVFALGYTTILSQSYFWLSPLIATATWCVTLTLMILVWSWVRGMSRNI